MIPKAKLYLTGIISRNEIRTLVFFEIIVGISLSFLLLYLFVFISDAVLAHETIYFDNLLTQYIISFRQPWLTSLMHTISMLGEQILMIQAVLVVILLTLRRHRKETFIFSILLIVGLIVTNLLKINFQIPRPEGFALIRLDSYSFPSGHTINSLLFYGTISYFTYHLTKNKLVTLIIFLISALIIFFIGISRVYLGVHRPVDVIAGYVVGLWLLVTIILIDKTVDYYKLVKENNNL